jgi:hypothetical protein
MATAQELIKLLDLKPHKEGGYFSEVWRSPEMLAVNALPPRYSGSRSLSTSIYYLITPESFSRMHRLRSDEIFHFLQGDPVEMLLLGPKSAAQRGGAKGDQARGHWVILGTDVQRDRRPMVVVRRGTWQGAALRTKRKGAYALMGTTMAPGFEYDDYEEGNRIRLSEQYPEFADKIRLLTRQ